MEKIGDGGFILDKPNEIEAFRLLSMRGRMQLELSGLKFRINTFQAVREQFGWQNVRSRQKVFDLFEEMLRERGILRDAEA